MVDVYLQRIAENGDAGGSAHSEKNIKLLLPVHLGRGPLLKCCDTKVSRRHAVLESKHNDIIITSAHVNPTYVVVSGKQVILTKGDLVVLNHGDEFALLKDKFVYRLIIMKQTVGLAASEGAGQSVKGKDRSDGKANTSTHVHDLDEADNYEDKENIVSSNKNKVDEISSILNSGAVKNRARNLPNWMLNPTLTKKAKINSENEGATGLGEKAKKIRNGSPKKASSPSKSKVSSERNSVHDVSQSTGNNEKGIEVHHIVSDEEDSDNEAGSVISHHDEAHSSPINSATRESCIFGHNCYRSNPNHQSLFAHPGDADYVEPRIADEVTSDDDRLECEFGLGCYRQNPRHKREFRHTKKPQPQRNSKKKAKLRKDDDSENEYDFNDSFLNDDSSDDYAPTDTTDDDSDFEPFQEDQENTRRMLKEAKKFVRTDNNSSVSN